MSQVQQDYESLERRAGEQPGLEDLLKVYGGYEEVAKAALSYLNAAAPAYVIINSNSSVD
jgi:hypothetical protein